MGGGSPFWPSAILSLLAECHTGRGKGEAKERALGARGAWGPRSP